jgi:hypothetical protein
MCVVRMSNEGALHSNLVGSRKDRRSKGESLIVLGRNLCDGETRSKRAEKRRTVETSIL